MRTNALAICCVFSLVAAPLAAQASRPAPDAYKTSGLNLGIALSGAALSVEDGDTESGGGLSLRLGYGFNRNILAFLEIQGASMEFSEIDDTYILAHADLGVRYLFATGARKVVQFVEGAFSALGTSWDTGDRELGTVELRGSAVSVGGGTLVYLNRTTALDLGLKFTFGSLDEGRVSGGRWQDLGESFSATSTRLTLGISINP